ncbi:MAG: iron-sulfur cluster assembly accessory protein [Acidobacteria bacterium]|nr:iron-sulfur cluster assembly accessory protein [Acidobacteriota bacterium]
MNPLSETQLTEIQLTEQAAQQIRQVMEQQPNVAGLRLGVQGGGCSGFSYVIKFEASPRARDHVFEFGGAKVFVDPKSLEYLKGLLLDFKADLMQQGFVLQNPNATHSCGCGLSFSVERPQSAKT